MGQTVEPFSPNLGCDYLVSTYALSIQSPFDIDELSQTFQHNTTYSTGGYTLTIQMFNHTHGERKHVRESQSQVKKIHMIIHADKGTVYMIGAKMVPSRVRFSGGRVG